MKMTKTSNLLKKAGKVLVVTAAAISLFATGCSNAAEDGASGFGGGSPGGLESPSGQGGTGGAGSSEYDKDPAVKAAKADYEAALANVSAYLPFSIDQNWSVLGSEAASDVSLLNDNTEGSKAAGNGLIAYSKKSGNLKLRKDIKGVNYNGGKTDSFSTSNVGETIDLSSETGDRYVGLAVANLAKTGLVDVNFKGISKPSSNAAANSQTGTILLVDQSGKILAKKDNLKLLSTQDSAETAFDLSVKIDASVTKKVILVFSRNGNTGTNNGETKPCGGIDVQVLTASYATVDAEGNAVKTPKQIADEKKAAYDAAVEEAKANADGSVVKYTVTFNLDGGNGDAEPQTVNAGKKADKPADPSKAHFDFAGWKAADAENNFDFDNDTVNANIVLTAQWTAKEYTIAFDLNGASGTAPASVTAKFGEEILLPEVESFTVEGKTAIGWALSDNADSALTGKYTLDDDLILAGKFFLVSTDKSVYTVTFDSKGGDAVASQKVIEGNKASEPASVTKAGYEFKAWKNGDSTFNFNDELKENVTLTAEWELVTYTITYAETKDAENTNKVSYTIEDEEIALVPIAKDGYTFNGWKNEAGEAVTSIAAASTGNKTFTASWTAIEYEITYELDGGENEASNPAKYTTEKAVTLKAPAKAKYNFAGWKIDGVVVTEIAAGSIGNKTVTATWEEIPVTSVTISGKSSAFVGGSVTLTATVQPANATHAGEITWTGAANGVVNTSSVGTVNVTASCGGVTSAVFSVEVKDKSALSVEVVKAEGLLNSSYMIFNQLDGVDGYKVTIDGKVLDNELIRYYDEYVWYEKSEDANLQVQWTKKSLNKVVRADALGLAAGIHEMKVCAIAAGASTENYTTESLTVKDHDRSGFAFTSSETPGAYKMDGTLKDGTIVIYLTEENKNTVKASIKGTEYTGIAAITQAVKAKNTGTTPVCIRVIGKVTLPGLSCSDMSSAYALGVKEAKFVTIEGVGDDATMRAGAAAFSSEYIEIANLGLMKWGGGKDGDGVSLKKTKYAWIHNNDYFYGDSGSDADQAKGDGSMDLKDDSQYVTISYNHFWDSGKMSLCGMKSESGPNYITYHHNWFDHSDSRHPRIRTMTVHVYNNYFDGNSKYGVGVTCGGNAFVEQNFYRNAHNPMMISRQGTDAQGEGTFSGESGGQIKAYANKFVQNNTNGVKFQFITNKYDYTNNKELGEYKEWYEDVGTDNGNGTWTIYDSKVTSDVDGFADNSLIFVEEASKKGTYYQASKGKTFFTLPVPANAKKITFKAKTGSSTSGATSTIKLVNADTNSAIATSSAIGNTDYVDVEFDLSLTSDTRIEVVNGSGSNSLNISGIKLISEGAWRTKLTSGADFTNIDAYEVDSRSDLVPETVKSRSGNFGYSNFDTTMGDSGLGLKNLPTDADTAKACILEYAGRHNPNLGWNFNNAEDDEKYNVNNALNSAILACLDGPNMKHVQGAIAAGGDDGNTTGGTTGGSGDNGGTTGGNTDPTPAPTPDPTPTGTTIVSLVNGGMVSPSSTLVTATGSVNKKDSNGAVNVTYNNNSYGTVKMESSTAIVVKAPAGCKVTVVGSLYSGKKNYFKLNGTKVGVSSAVSATTQFEYTFTASAGDDTIERADTASIGLIIIEPAN